MSQTKIEWADYRENNNRIKTPEGYVLVYCPNHPHAKSKGHIYEHRYIMEKFLNRFLLRSEHIHHKNGIKDDNRIENLDLNSHSGHAKYHSNGRDKTKFLEGSLTYSHARKLLRIMVLCACGCGTKLIDRDSKGRHRYFIQGHNAKGKHWRWHGND